MTLVVGVILFAFYVFFVLGVVILISKIEYNNGKCRMCGGKFIQFDMDSSGAVGYKCNQCGNVIWKDF